MILGLVRRVVRVRERYKGEKVMQEYQKRVVEERDELGTRVGKLKSFITTGVFKALDEEEQVRMKMQVVLMVAYLEVLNERIEAFKKEGVE